VRQGILVRDNSVRDETVELSPSASVAVRFLAGLETHGRTVTRSRLANVADLLARLARDTDTAQEGRLAALRAEQAEIERQIAQVEAGEFIPIAADEAVERLAEVLLLAQEIPGDFARVSADLRGINTGLREQILNTVGSRGDVLDAVFNGVDLIDTSEAGRSFRAFNALLVDQQRSQELEDSITQVLSRDFAEPLTDQECAFLRDFMAALERESAHVRATMTGFSRSLRSFVQSRAYQEHRALRDAIAEALTVALDLARQGNLTVRVGYELPSTSVSLASVGTWRLNNPADVRTANPVSLGGAKIQHIVPHLGGSGGFRGGTGVHLSTATTDAGQGAGRSERGRPLDQHLVTAAWEKHQCRMGGAPLDVTGATAASETCCCAGSRGSGGDRRANLSLARAGRKYYPATGSVGRGDGNCDTNHRLPAGGCRTCGN
jgi:hypothetical protein